MKSIHNILFLLFAAAVAGFGQSADDYFHTAAKLFIYGDDSGCKNTIDEGLRRYPEDAKLAALKKKIKEQKKQDQKQDQSKNQDKRDKDKQNKDKDQNQDKNKENQQKQAQDENKEEQKPPEEKSQQAQKKPGELSPEEAKRLLDALKQDETDMQKRLMLMRVPTKKMEKDW